MLNNTQMPQSQMRCLQDRDAEDNEKIPTNSDFLRMISSLNFT